MPEEKQRQPFHKRASSRGFSLIEMLLAVALGGMLLSMVAFQVVSLSSIWMNQNDDDYFLEHANGVAEFLSLGLGKAEGLLQEDETAGSGRNASARTDSGQEGSRNTREASGEEKQRVNAMEWARPPGYSELDEPLLSFRLNEAPPLLQEYDIPFPWLIAYLHFAEGKGVSLLWHSELLEVEDMDEVNHTVLSPFADQMEYCYFDDENETWEITSEPMKDENGQYPLPNFLRLRFTYQDMTHERTVFLPPANQNVPLF